MQLEIKPSRIELLTFAGLLTFMMMAGGLTQDLWPNVWMDEAIWSEPAINLVRTGHFTTMVSQLEPADTFYCTQSPLYPLALSLWIRGFGETLHAIRWFN